MLRLARGRASKTKGIKDTRTPEVSVDRRELQSSNVALQAQAVRHCHTFNLPQESVHNQAGHSRKVWEKICAVVKIKASCSVQRRAAGR